MNFMMNRLKIEPAAPAIIMAYGIFFIGAIGYFPFMESNIYLLLCLFVLAFLVVYVWLFFYFIKQRKILELMQQPVRAFALGTWVAGLSVCSIVIKTYVPILLPLLQMMTILNVFILFLLCIIYIVSIIRLWTKEREVKVDGIVLLSTVSIQSGVLMIYHMFGTVSLLFHWMIGLGILFYILGLVRIMQSYRRIDGTLADDWANTNCIIHGALSITGLALVMTEIYSLIPILLLWSMTSIFLLCIEGIEVIRAVQRWKRYGFRHGLFTYHVTQWSRNFTFGMYYTFTWTMYEKGVFARFGAYETILENLLAGWAMIVLIFLSIQTILFIYGKATSLLKAKQTI